MMNVLDRIKKECDVILIVADARNPEATLFPFKSTKKRIVVFNKVDLCSESELNSLRKKHKGAIFVSTRTREGKKWLMHTLDRIAKKENRLIRVGVIGYPNVGKSSLINMLRGKKSAHVSPIPGETKGVQWIKVKDSILMYDTPGVIGGSKNECDLAKLCAIAPENIKDAESVAVEIIKDIVNKYGLQKICNAYDIECERNETPERILEKIAVRHGMLLKKGELNLDRAAKKIIRDWQTGKIK